MHDGYIKGNLSTKFNTLEIEERMENIIGIEMSFVSMHFEFIRIRKMEKNRKKYFFIENIARQFEN